MSVSSRLQPLAWIVVLLGAVGFLFWVNDHRASRLAAVAALADAAALPGGRELIVPGRHEATFAWIEETQQMLAHGEWRVRWNALENAPAGRMVTAPSPYRWWVALNAWRAHLASGRPAAQSVEAAARWADPLLFILALGLLVLACARGWGGVAAAVVAVGAAGFFPLAAGFVPGVLDHHGLGRLLALASIAALLGGFRAAGRPERWFAAAGAIGGAGVWIDARTLVPVLAGAAVGGLLSLLVDRKNSASRPVPAPWRNWALAGALTIGLADLIEYAPAHLGVWNFDSCHPVFGVAWLGAGELLHRLGDRRSDENPRRRFSKVFVGLFLALAALASLPLALHFTDHAALLARDTLSIRLTNQTDGVAALSLAEWFRRDGPTAAAVATLLPLILLAPAAGFFFLRATSPENRRLLALLAGPLAVAVSLACLQLAWWQMVDGLLLLVAGLVIAAPANTTASRTIRWATGLAVVAAVAGGIGPQLPGKTDRGELHLTLAETEQLVERDLARWLARRAAGTTPVVFAPPLASTTLGYFGRLRGIGSFARDNRAGFGVTLMIAGANTLEEAQALLEARDVRYVVVPSWDPFFDEFAAHYLDARFSNRTSLLATSLRRWEVPAWLRPLPYQMPEIAGFERQSVLVFERIDNQSPAVAASRLAEFFVETGRLEQAAAAEAALRSFPGDVGALAALAQVQNARDDSVARARTVETLRLRIELKGDRYLPWDRRVSVAAVLAQGKLLDLARDQARRCIAEVDEPKLRFLTPGALYSFNLLSTTFNLPVADPHLRQLALDLLPDELRRQL